MGAKTVIIKLLICIQCLFQACEDDLQANIYFLKNRGEMNSSGDDLKTKHVETSGVNLVIRLYIDRSKNGDY